MRKMLPIIIGVLVALLVSAFVKDAIIKASVEKGVEMVTGLKLRIQGFKAGLVNSLVAIRNLRLFNPRGFKDSVMLDMPEIYVDYDLPAVFKGKIHLKEVRIDLKEFYVIKNAKGEVNLDSLKVVQESKGEAPAKEKPAEEGKGMEFQIDTLQLKVGKVVYKDYSQGGEPKVQEFSSSSS